MDVIKKKSKTKKISFRILWSKVKNLGSSWQHIRCSIAGEADTVKCVVCGEEKPLGLRRQSTVLEMARTHYYKHKLFNSAINPDGGGQTIRCFLSLIIPRWIYE